MATATLPLVWKGRAGRAFMPVEGAAVRHGRVAAVRKVQAVGVAEDSAGPNSETPLALKLWTEGGEQSLDQLQREIRTLTFASTAAQAIAPKVVDVVGSPSVVGVVLEWCSGNLEDWWGRTLREPDAFGRLMTVLAEVARQVDAWHTHAAARGGLDSAHGDLKPTNVLLGTTGRWLISDFGAPPVDPPADSPWAESDVIPGGGAFLAPELRFYARVELPKAVDVWSLGAIAFAMLRMRRIVLDGSPLPRNGTASLRFAPVRAEQVSEVYRSSPARFFERDLEPTAFPTPERLPEPDRKAIRESLRGALGEEDEALEAELTTDVLKVLDRALTIAPERRYADAETLANALDDLARKWISLAARKDEQGNPDAVPGPVIEALIRERDVARARAAAVQSEMSCLQDRIDRLQDALVASQNTPPEPAAVQPASAPTGPDRTPLLMAGIAAIVLLQLGTLAGIAALLVAVIVG